MTSRIIASVIAVVWISGCSLPLVSESEIEAESEAQFQKMRVSQQVSTNASQRRYINCVARAIIGELEDPYASLDWEIEVFDEDAINAFAMPGGKIGVFTGIFKAARNQDQLAAVLGHEVAHVTEQHSLERANREATTRIGVIGAAAATGAGQYGDLIAMGAQLGLSLPYGRGQESEADIVGLDYMAAAGFDPRASVSLWKNMAEENKAGPPEWLSTHPAPDTRIEDLIEAWPAALELYNGARESGKRPRCEP